MFLSGANDDVSNFVINNLYGGILGRDPIATGDQEGVSYWVNRISSEGLTPQQAADTFVKVAANVLQAPDLNNEQRKLLAPSVYGASSYTVSSGDTIHDALADLRVTVPPANVVTPPVATPVKPVTTTVTPTQMPSAVLQTTLPPVTPTGTTITSTGSAITDKILQATGIDPGQPITQTGVAEAAKANPLVWAGIGIAVLFLLRR